MEKDESWRNQLTKAGTPRKRPPRKPPTKWEPKEVEVVYHVIPQEEFDQRLSEVSERLYDYFCEIERKKKISAEPIT